MPSCLLPVAICVMWTAAGPLFAACPNSPCDIGLPGDFDDDGDVDPSDFVLFRRCETESQSRIAPRCRNADLDRDGAIDAADFAIWQSHYTGACNCDPILKEPRTQPFPPTRTAAPELPDPVWLTPAMPPDIGSLGWPANEARSGIGEPELPRALDPRVFNPAGPVTGDPNPMFRVRGHSGEFQLEVTDLRIRGRGMDLVWTRTYRSRTGRGTAAGNGWDFSYNIRLEPMGEHLVLHDGRGRADVLLARPDGTWSRPELFAVLEKDGDTCALSWANGEHWSFHPLDDAPAAGRISRISDRNANHLTFLYDSQGRLTRIRDTLDEASNRRELTVSYNADGLIEAVNDFTGRRVTYSYYDAASSGGSTGDLRSVTSPAVTGTPTGNDFPAGKTITYTYSHGVADERLNHNLLTITDAKGQTWLRNIYSDRPDQFDQLWFDRVVRQVYGGPGDHVDTVYQPVTPSSENDSAVISATVNDRVGNVRVYFYDARNRLVMRREYAGRADADRPTDLIRQENLPTHPLRAAGPPYSETRYSYNQDSLCTSVLRPERDQERFVYDQSNPDPRARANLLEHVRLPGPAGGDQPQIVEVFAYDERVNRVSRRIDARGNETRYRYDESGNCTQIQHPPGSVAEYFEYNAFGQLTAHLWPDGGADVRRRDEYVYHTAAPQRGFLAERILDADGAALSIRYGYDPLGRFTRRRDPRGLESSGVWNALDQLVRRASPEVSPGTGARSYCDYVYDANDCLIHVQQGGWGEPPDANTPEVITTFEYDILNCLLRRIQRGSGGACITEYAYDDNRNRTLTRYGEAAAGRQPTNTLTVLHDERDLPFRVIRAAGDPLQSSMQYDYDGNGRLRRITAGLESLNPQQTVLAYDGYGRCVRRADAMGNEQQYRYDAAGNMVEYRVDGELEDTPGRADNVRLQQTFYEYDLMNRLERRIDSIFDPHTQEPGDEAAAVTRYEYTDSGLLRRIVSAAGQPLTLRYDSLGRRTLIRDARGNTAAIVYGPNSNVTGLTETARSDLGRAETSFTRTFEYDGLDRVIRAAAPSSGSYRYGWDALSRCTLITTPGGHQTRCEYDALGRLVQRIIDMDGDGADPADAADIVISQRWDDSSRLITQTDANLNITSYTYDPLDRLIATRFADQTTQTAIHDVFDRPVTLTDPAGTVIRSTYDLLNRLAGRSIVRGPGISGVTSESYVYDGLSRMVMGADDDSAVTRQYDALGRLTRETQAIGPGGTVRAISATHDMSARRTTLTYPGGRRIVTSFDPLGRPSAIRDETPGASSLIAAYSYLGPERIERRDLGNGLRLDVEYDEGQRVSNLRYTAIGPGTLVVDRADAWDEAGNRVQSLAPSDPGGDTMMYFYDAANRLVQTQLMPGSFTISYSLDGAGNRTSVSGGPEAGAYLLDPTEPEPADLQMNQYTAVPGQPRSYDRAGNLAAAGSTCRYSHDYRGQLTELTDLSAGLTVLYKYDVLGRRIEKNAAGIITRTYYWGNQEIEEQNVANITLATFVHPGPQSGRRGFIEAGPLQVTRGTQPLFRLTDDLGTCLALTSAAGALLERYDYTNFGQPTFIDPAGLTLPGSVAGHFFLFRGLRYEMESGFYTVPAPIADANPVADGARAAPDAIWAADAPCTRPDAPVLVTGTPGPCIQTFIPLAPPRDEPAWLSGDTPIASRAYDPAVGRFITRTRSGPWPPESLGNPYTAWRNNPLSP